jgi:exopolyphosphatase/guanosine-5'-triphosphate,3'-diphosphate pyrophosphatase
MEDAKSRGAEIFLNAVDFLGYGAFPDEGDRRVNYAILNIRSLSNNLIKVDYDIESVENSIRDMGLPENFAQMFLCGVSLDAVIEDEDRIKEREKELGYEKRLKDIREIARKYDPDPEHSDTVRSLSLELFDKMEGLHVLGYEERYWLECAAILHDIGWSQGSKGHHKSSLGLILNDQEFPFTSDERYIIGSIARYHRKAHPKNSHFHFAAISQDNKQKVKVLASILRIADGMDASHSSVVTNIDLKIDHDSVILDCFVSNDTSLECESILKKKDLFESIIGKKLIVKWLQKY